ncbi:MAG: DUF5915 domain-containing protein, partial [Candidatus Sericytochromatia bacterium]
DLRHPEVEERMSLIQSAVYMGRALRAKHLLKTRQPLKAIHLVTKNKEIQQSLAEMEDLIKDELNVKEVLFSDKEESLVNLSAKANFKVLGSRFGKNMKDAAAKIQEFSVEDVVSMENGNTVDIVIADQTFPISLADIIIQRTQKEGMVAESQNGLTVALDTYISPKLLEEGIAREFINRVQTIRKESNFEVTDKIKVTFSGQDSLKTALFNNLEYIKSETLTLELEYQENVDNGQEKEINEFACSIKVEKN